MVLNQRQLAAALLLFVCAGAQAGESNQCESPGAALKRTLNISAGGPYVTKCGVPVTLKGTYAVSGQTDNLNRLKSIAQALQGYAHDHGSYPPAALLNARGQQTVSWRVLVLPYLGEKSLYDQFDLSKPWDSSVNLCLLDKMPAVYRKSSAGEGTMETGFAGVTGANSLFENTSAQLNGGRPLSEISATQTIAAGPVGQSVHLPWTAPGDIDITKATQLGSSRGFSGEGGVFTPLAFLDGSVHLVPNNVASVSMSAWTQAMPLTDTMNMMKIACSPPNALDTGVHARWDLGNISVLTGEGWNATFSAAKPGTYTVTLHVFDTFGNTYNQSTKVTVR